MRDQNQMLAWMALFVGLALGAAALLFVPLRAAFQANAVFNGLILAVLVVGIAVTFAQVLALRPAARWIETADRGIPPGPPPRILAPLARVIAARGDEPVRMSTLAMRSLLDGVRMRLDESREISRYLVGLLILLGLLGTFWGLLDTLGGVGRVIGGLGPGGGTTAQVFDELKRNLQGPLAGMGTAFSSSLFGLAGALVLGLLDLQAGHAQNRYFSHVEETLSARAHLPHGALGGEGETALPPYIEALLQQTAENLGQIQRLMAKGEEERRALQTGVAALTEQLSALTDQLRSEQKLIVSLARNQTDLKPAIAELAGHLAGTLASNEEMRAHLRNADTSLERLVQEVAGAREQMPEALRQEVRVLVRSITRPSASQA